METGMKLALAIFAGTVVFTATEVTAADLALRRVVLSTGGVGYYEYEASVSGRDQLRIVVRRDQVDDVLKSLVVYDSEGRIESIGLAGQNSETGLFREMPFTPEQLTAPQALLNALRGSEVTLVGPTPLSGRIVAVTAEQGQTTRHRITLMTPTGLRSAVLEEAESVRFADPAVQAQIDRALAGVAALGRRDRRMIAISLDGRGSRQVRVAFVAGAPLWKATYRLTLAADPKADKAALQGWAVVENESGEDWRDVDLTLISGHPVTFRQALYAPYFVERPAVPVEVWSRVLPLPVDAGSTTAAAPAPARDLRRLRQGDGLAMPRASAAMAAGPAERKESDDSDDGAIVAEGDTRVAFRMPSPVSVANGHSILVPLVRRDVPAERVVFFDGRLRQRHPMASVSVTNDSGAVLPPGVVTVYGSGGANGGVEFLGDARLGALPAGESRMLSYAQDFKTRMEVAEGVTQRVDRVSAADGVVTVTSIAMQSTTYRMTTAPGEPRSIVVEHPRPGEGWSVVRPAGSDRRTTPTGERMARVLGAGTTATLGVDVERPLREQVSIDNIDENLIAFWVSGATLTAEARAMLGRLAESKRRLAEATRAQETDAKRIDGLARDQDRVRRNIPLVTGDAQRQFRDELVRLDEQIRKAQQALEASRGTVESAEQQLRELVRSMRF
jgi:hypothetical protein